MAKRKKSPFVTYSEKEVALAESQYFVLHFGKGLVTVDDYFFFTKEDVEKLYKKTLRRLVKITKTGDAKNKKHALKMIAQLMIRPMRLH